MRNNIAPRRRAWCNNAQRLAALPNNAKICLNATVLTLKNMEYGKRLACLTMKLEEALQHQSISSTSQQIDLGFMCRLGTN